MASSMVVLVFVKLLLDRCTITNGSTHWVVTEDGRLQSQIDSIFNLRRPYDLVAFMRQEERAQMLGNLKRELLSRKNEIDRHEDRDSAGIEQRFYQTDPDCIETGKPLPEFDLYISTVLPLENKGIRAEEHVEINKALRNVPPMPPDCQTVTDLQFSMHAFEHLEGLKERRNLSGTPELGLKNAITHRENVDEYGHLVHEALQKNKTSWVLYNMAAFYWRIKGEPFQAIECIRRALHFSPRHQKDVALISLANILHRAHYSNEAAILVHSALDISRELNVNHFTLGNIYAVLGEYNKSVICFENTLKIQPDFEAAAKRKHAVLCHSKLEAALETQHKALQKTLKELKDYQKKHDLYQQQNEKLAAEQVPTEVKIAQRISYESARLKENNDDLGEYCRMVEKEGKQVLTCSWSRIEYDLQIVEEPLPAIPEIPQEEERSAPRKVPVVNVPEYSKPLYPPRFPSHNAATSKILDRMTEDWPDKDECDTFVQKVPDPRNLSTSFLSPENKGFEVKALLTEAQGLQQGGEHPLPWYPPVCVPLMPLPEGSQNSYDHLKSVSYAERSRIPLKYTDPAMKPTLLLHVNEGSVTEEEVGQRILTALKQNIGPKWVLFNLAGLYWRIIGNNYHSIECLRRALHLCPSEYRDVPLNNLAGILYRWGRIDDALLVMRDALNVSNYEPASNVLYAHLLWASSNHSGAIWHYQRALEEQPELADALSNLRALKCYLKYHQAAQSVAPVETPTTPLAHSCPQKSGIGNLVSGQTESRVICKTENGEEKCIIETRMRSKVGECNGQCTQTCTITPVKVDHCAGLSGDLTLDALPAAGIQQQCSQKGQAFAADQEDLLFNNDFTGKLDEVAEYYERRGLCQGEECNQLRVQQGSQRPHVKLEYVDGVLHHKLIFLNAPGDLHVQPNECVIFNDGSRSLGCSRSEFRTYQQQVIAARRQAQPDVCYEPAKLDDYEEMEKDVAAINSLLSQDLHAHCQYQTDDTTVEFTASLPQGPEQARTESVLQKRLEQAIRNSVSENNFPDLSSHLVSGYHLDWNLDVCRTTTQQGGLDYMTFDFQTFTSTWLSLSAKNVRLDEHIDFEERIENEFDEPVCDKESVSSVTSYDHIAGVADRHDLQYTAEEGLRELLLKLGGEEESVDMVGTRIARALQQTPTSWVLANTAALYWRVKGDAVNAINCLQLALTYAPHEVRDASLLSLANVLQQTGHLNDAVVVMAEALDVGSRLPVLHFTLANLYAAKGDWERAAKFYQSTLALQPGFRPAVDRLKAIQCQGHISQPVPKATGPLP